MTNGSERLRVIVKGDGWTMRSPMLDLKPKDFPLELRLVPHAGTLRLELQRRDPTP